MNRFLVALVAAGALASAAPADIPPPPPPKGKKYIAVSNEVVLGKDVSGYVFVERVVMFRPAPAAPTYRKLDLSAEKGTATAAAPRRTAVSLIAVPKDAAAAFKTDAELFDALTAKKVKGTHVVEFTGTTTVPDTIKGDAVKWKVTITGIDAKGIQKKTEGEGYEQTPPLPGRGAPSPAGYWAPGVAVALALMFGGVWLAGRGRRKL